MLVGKFKKGKSWMALGTCEAVAVGGGALGTKRVDQGDTLYLACVLAFGKWDGDLGAVRGEGAA